MPTFAGSEVAYTRSRIGVASHSGTPEQVTEARRDHAAAKIAEFIRRTVDNAPPLTPEQRDKLATLLRDAPSERESGDAA